MEVEVCSYWMVVSRDLIMMLFAMTMAVVGRSMLEEGGV